MMLNNINKNIQEEMIYICVIHFQEKKTTNTKQNVNQIKQLDVSDLIHQSSRSGGSGGAGKAPEVGFVKYIT